MRRALVVAAFLLVLLGLWQGAALSGRWSPVLLPPPAMVGHYLLDALRDGSLLEAIEVTLRRLYWLRDRGCHRPSARPADEHIRLL